MLFSRRGQATHSSNARRDPEPKRSRNLDLAQVYNIACITVLPLEKQALHRLLDEHHECPRHFVKGVTDRNDYTWGKLSGHNVVIASCPSGESGTHTTARVAQALRGSLPHIRMGLLIGTGLGVPDRGISLGDIVVSQPNRTCGGVVQYDLYKAKGVNERIGHLNSPPRAMRTAVSGLQADHEIAPSRITEYLEIAGFTCQAQSRSASFSDRGREPGIHYGTIASANTHPGDSTERDRIVAFLADVDPLCFDDQAAGLMNILPCLVIRGICGFAGSVPSQPWQVYAATAAAAYAKEVLTCADFDTFQSPDKHTNPRETTMLLAAVVDALHQSMIDPSPGNRQRMTELLTSASALLSTLAGSLCSDEAVLPQSLVSRLNNYSQSPAQATIPVNRRPATSLYSCSSCGARITA